MAKIKWELEDLAFKFLYAQEYKEHCFKVVASRDEREVLIESFAEPLRKRLQEENIEATVIGRPKTFLQHFTGKCSSARQTFRRRL